MPLDFIQIPSFGVVRSASRRSFTSLADSCQDAKLLRVISQALVANFGSLCPVWLAVPILHDACWIIGRTMWHVQKGVEEFMSH